MRHLSIAKITRGISAFSTASRDEILLEHADGSMFVHCIIEYATWGLHSHFTKLAVKGSLFRHNTGGIRFRSGPVEIKGSVFADNSVGMFIMYSRNIVLSRNVLDHNRGPSGYGIGLKDVDGLKKSFPLFLAVAEKR